ncbi:MAG: alanine racemase [Acidaminococcaceae bacterium]|nr:alanine racemase [Acidaminococcaceae bacterium]
MQNIETVARMLHAENKTMCAVVKGFSADEAVMQILEESGCDWLASSRIEDLAKLQTQKTRLLIRLSQPCEIKEVVCSSEVSFESECKTILLLQEEAGKQNKTHGIMLAIDMGDLREGIFYRNLEEIDEAAAIVLQSSNLQLLGVGTNLGCFGGVITDAANMQGLIDVATHIEQRFSVKLPYISGMSTAAMEMIENKTMPLQVNHGRFGEAWLLGFDSVDNRRLAYLHDDAFLFKAQIIEIKEKPSQPIGTIGGNAFGQHVEYKNEGTMKRALLAFGTQDVEYEYLVPLDENIEIIGASSDHTIISLHGSDEYQVGDVVTFKLKYHALLHLYTSRYVKKYVV